MTSPGDAVRLERALGLGGATGQSLGEATSPGNAVSLEGAPGEPRGWWSLGEALAPGMR